LNAPGASTPRSGCRQRQQRFGSDHGIVGKTDLRLEIDLEFVLGKGAPELETEAAPRLRLGPQHRA